MTDTAAFKHIYPFRSNWLDLNGLRYHYLDEGPRESPVVLMVHGNPTWSFYYRNLIPEISRKFRVIVPDHMGCGLSDKPQTYAYTLAQHIQNLQSLAEHLELKEVTLVMHDWGGAIGMGYACRRPEVISGFVVFNTSAFFVPRVPRRIRMCRIPKIGDFLVRGINGFSLAGFLFAFSQHRRLKLDMIRGYLAPYNNWHNRVAIHRFVKDIPLEAGHPTRETLDNIEKALTGFRDRPMLIIWGAEDFCFTLQDFLPRWQALFPDADVHVLDHAGHYVVEDAHEKILPLMKDFLQKITPAER